MSRIVAIAILLSLHAPIVRADRDVAPLLAHANDYTFGYYPYGWRGANAEGDRIFAIQTNRYALTINTTTGNIDHLGALTESLTAADALSQGNDLLHALPALDMTCEVIIDGVTFSVAGGAPKPDDVVLYRLGRYLQHVQLRGLTFRATGGSELSGVNAWLDVYGWSDRVSVVLHVESVEATNNIEPTMRFRAGAAYKGDNSSANDSAVAVLRSEDGGGVAFVNPLPGDQDLQNDGDSVIVRAPVREVSAGSSTRVAVAILPDSTDPLAAGTREAKTIRHFTDDSGIRATGIAPYTGPLEVTYDPVIGWHRVLLGENPDINVMERARVELKNPTDAPQTLRLCFAKEGGSFGITGMSPVLRDTQGLPIGLPVQISKNWHVRPSWFTGLTMLDLDPGVAENLEFDLAYAKWGGVPAVSHAQLCLEGWGTNQQWDQMAIGSFGESICYDPDLNLNRGMIDDMRPLMVWGMGEKPQKQWSWTHNVGGGDFLVLHAGGERQFLTRQKTLYGRYGPVLSDVTYAGETPDGAIQSTVRTQSWRTNDYVRALYTLRYDVIRPVADIERLAFFQLGADRYNHNLFTTVARGNLDGIVESWTPEMGGWRYSRRGEPLEGEHPWIALTGATKNPPPHIKEGDQGAWANRGFIVRSWNARLGGQRVGLPHYAIFRTEDGGVPSAIVELSPPPEVTALSAGDFVEAEVEMLILPQHAEEYYGPNDALRNALAEHPDSWRLVHREAVLGNIDVNATTGQVIHAYPIVIRAGKDGHRAEFTVRGGVGYVPVTIAGAAKRGPFSLTETVGAETRAIDQSTPPGNDWWQTEYHPESRRYDVTFTIPMGSENRVRTYAWTLLDSTK